MNIAPKFRIFGLDLLRAIAISLVVISHITYLLNFNESSILVISVRALGAIGVDLFFVLSGFLIGGIILKRIHSGKTTFKDLIVFWKRRWLRTLPNYFLILLLNIIVFYLIKDSFEKNLIHYFFFFQNFISGHPSFFSEAWSLSVEEYAYILLPFILYLNFYIFKTNKKEKLFLWTTFATIIIIGILKVFFFQSHSFSSYKEWSNLYRKVVIYRIDAIYIGFLLVYFMKKYTYYFEKRRKMFFVVGTSIFLLLHLFMNSFGIRPETHSWFYVFIYLQAIILSIGLIFPFFYHLKYKGIFFKPIEFISLHSYAIYLINYSLILIPIQKIVDVSTLNIFEKIGIIFSFLSLTLVLSRMLFVGFEKPILDYRDKKYSRVQSTQSF